MTRCVKDDRGSSLFLVLVFVAALGGLVAALLPALLAERDAVDHDYLRLVAEEAAEAGLVAAGTLPGGVGTFEEPALLERPGLRASVTARAWPLLDGVALESEARVTSVGAGVVCTQRMQARTGPVDADGRPVRIAMTVAPFACAPAD